jgi:hypothetical protein
MPMTKAEADAIHAAAAARGEQVCIEDVITDLDRGPIGRLAERTFPWAYPKPAQPEMEAGR